MDFPAAKGRQAHAVPEKEPKTHLINAMHRIHEDSVKVGYNHEGDSLKLPPNRMEGCGGQSRERRERARCSVPEQECGLDGN